MAMPPIVAVAFVLSGCGGSESCHDLMNKDANKVTVKEFCDTCKDCTSLSDQTEKTACLNLKIILGSCPSSTATATSPLKNSTSNNSIAWQNLQYSMAQMGVKEMMAAKSETAKNAGFDQATITKSETTANVVV